VIEIDSIQRTWTAQGHRRNKPGNSIQRRTHLLTIKSDNKKIPDLLDLSIIKGHKDFCRTESCLELSSDHSPINFIINSKIMTKNKSCNDKTEWLYFQELLKTTLDSLFHWKPTITCAVECFNHAVQQVVWSATPTSSNSKIRIQYSLVIKEKIAKKRKLRKLWQTNRCPVLKNKLNHAIKTSKSWIGKESGDTKIFKEVKHHSWNQLLAMGSHKKTEATADTSSAYQEVGRELGE